MASHIVIESNDIATGLVLMEQGVAATAEVISSNEVVTSSNITSV